MAGNLGTSIELELSQIKEERQSKRNAHQKCGKSRQPKKPYSQTSAFGLDEQNQHNCRDNNVKCKERADPIREKIANEKWHIQPVMLHDPRNELRVR